jgi:energy-coupling factor transporter transmembrane protein EcfT
LGVWVAFLKQPDALQRLEPQQKYIFELLFIHLLFFINDFFFRIFLEFIFIWVALPGSAGFFKKATQTPNAGQMDLMTYCFKIES